MANGNDTDQSTDQDVPRFLHHETPEDHAAMDAILGTSPRAKAAALDTAQQYRTPAVTGLSTPGSYQTDFGPSPGALTVAADTANQYRTPPSATVAAEETARGYRTAPSATAAAQDIANQYQRESQRSSMRDLMRGAPGDQQSRGAALQQEGQYQGGDIVRTIPKAPIDMNRVLQQAQDAAYAVGSTPAPVEDLSTRTPTLAESAARQTAGQYGGYETPVSPEDPEVRRASLVRLPEARVAERLGPGYTMRNGIIYDPQGNVYDSNAQLSAQDLASQRALPAAPVSGTTAGAAVAPIAPFLTPTQQPEVRRALPVTGQGQEPEVRRALPVTQTQPPAQSTQPGGSTTMYHTPDGDVSEPNWVVPSTGKKASDYPSTTGGGAPRAQLVVPPVAGTTAGTTGTTGGAGGGGGRVVGGGGGGGGGAQPTPQPSPEVRRALPVQQGQQQQGQVPRAIPVQQQGKSRYDTGDYPPIVSGLKTEQTMPGPPMDQQVADYWKQRNAWAGKRYVDAQGVVHREISPGSGTYVKTWPDGDGLGETWQFQSGRTEHHEIPTAAAERILNDELTRYGDLATGKPYNVLTMSLPEKSLASIRNRFLTSSNTVDQSQNHVFSNGQNAIEDLEQIKKDLAATDISDINRGAQWWLSARAHGGVGYQAAGIKPEVADLFTRLDKIRNTSEDTLGLDMPKTNSQGVGIPTMALTDNLKKTAGGLLIGAGVEGLSKFVQSMTDSKYDVNNLRNTIDNQIDVLKRNYYQDARTLAEGRWRVSTKPGGVVDNGNRYASELYKKGIHVGDSVQRPSYVSGPHHQELEKAPGAGGVWGLQP